MQNTTSTAIQQALQRISLFRLAHLFATRKQVNAYTQGKRQTIWEELIGVSDDKDEEMKTLIAVVYSCCESRIQQQAISSNYQEIIEAAKKQTKRLIVEFIQTQSKRSSTPQLFVRKQLFEKNSPENSFQQASNQSFNQSEVILSPKCQKVQKNDNCMKNQRKNDKKGQSKLEEHESEWEKIQQMAINSGNFLYGDKMACIQSLLVSEGEIFGLVQWKQRKGITLRSSLIQLDTIREHAPRELASYLQTYARDLSLS